MREIQLKVSGMHCESCEKIIQMDLSDIKGVIESNVDSKTGDVLVKTEDFVLPEVIKKTIEDAGYKTELIGE